MRTLRGNRAAETRNFIKRVSDVGQPAIFDIGSTNGYDRFLTRQVGQANTRAGNDNAFVLICAVSVGFSCVAGAVGVGIKTVATGAGATTWALATLAPANPIKAAASAALCKQVALENADLRKKFMLAPLVF